MYPSDEAWILYRETLGYSREESLKALREYQALFRQITTDRASEPQTPAHSDKA